MFFPYMDIKIIIKTAICSKMHMYLDTHIHGQLNICNVIHIKSHHAGILCILNIIVYKYVLMNYV